MDGREGGFIVIHRRIRSSPLYRSLTAEQRSVFLSLLLLANWKPGSILVGETWHVVERGELAHSLETIAGEAAVSVKVVRTTLQKLFTDDRPAGGRGPFILERWVGTDLGRPRRILTVVNYDLYQSPPADEGTLTGIVKGTTGARDGHETGTTRAPIEQGEPLEPVEPPSGGEVLGFGGRPVGGAGRAPRVGLGSPEGEALDHWRRVVWPKLSPDPCPPPGPEMNRLRELCRSAGVPAVKTAMERAEQDTYWRERLDLAAFVQHYGKFAARRPSRSTLAPKALT